MRCYEPPPERRPLLSRRPPWAGGLSLGAVIFALLLGGPAILAVCALVWEIDAIASPDR